MDGSPARFRQGIRFDGLREGRVGLSRRFSQSCERRSASLDSFRTTVFEIMSRLAIETGSIHLGQGSPGDRGPHPVLGQAAEFFHNSHNQYLPMLGISEWGQALAAPGKRFYELDIDWQS